MNLSLLQKLFIWLAASMLIALALRWIFIILFTTYRPQLHWPLSVVAAATLIYALGLVILNRWAVVLLFAASVLLFTGLVWLQLPASFTNPFLVCATLACVLYCGVLLPAVVPLTGRCS